MILGKVLADYRYANRLDGKDLAKTVGISAATLSRFEHGKSDGDATTLARLLTWLLSEQRQTKRQRTAPGDS